MEFCMESDFPENCDTFQFSLEHSFLFFRVALQDTEKIEVSN